MNQPERLNQLRDDIRSLDDEILSIMTRRLELAREVGRIKFENNLPIKNFKVEKEVIERAKARARDLGLYEKLAEEVAKLQIRYAVMTQEEHHYRNITSAVDARRIVIIGGCGSMGLWLTKFFKSFGHQVAIFDQIRSARLPDGVDFYDNLESAVLDAEFIVLATPISVTASLIDRLNTIKPAGIVFDICSLKGPVTAPIARAESAGIKITSIHPMFGAATELLSGQNIVFCETSDATLSQQVMSLFQDTTANLVRIPLASHDELMGYVLGMSHMLNLAFAKAINDSRFSYKDLESVASSTFRAQLDVAMPIINENQDLYFEIQSGNNHTKDLFLEIIQSFQSYLDAVSANDRTTFKQYMESSKKYFTS